MFLKTCKSIESLELWGWGAKGRNSFNPPFSTISHSLIDPKDTPPQPPPPKHPCIHPWPPLWSSLGGCSQAVVGKSRTTGSIYLTSVSSTIAKHHQRAAAPLRTNVSKRSSEEFKFKRKITRNIKHFNEQCCHVHGRRMQGLKVKVCLVLYWHYT